MATIGGPRLPKPVPFFGVTSDQPTATLALMPDWLNPEIMLSGLGVYVILVLCLVIFIESSIFPVLPGDTLLFTAGLFVANGTIKEPLWLVCVLVTASALIGNVVGYWIGYKLGPRLFNRPDSRIFKQEYVEQTHRFLEKHGPRAVVMARFIPFVRTFITWIAGIGRMDPKKFFIYTVIGGILWATGLTLLGAALGNIDVVKNNVEIVFVLIAVISLLPILIEYLRARKSRKATPSTD